MQSSIFKRSRFFPLVILLCFSAAAPRSYAGVVLNVLTQLGVMQLVAPLAEATGTDLHAPLLLVDDLVSGLLGDDGGDEMFTGNPNGNQFLQAMDADMSAGEAEENLAAMLNLSQVVDPRVVNATGASGGGSEPSRSAAASFVSSEYLATANDQPALTQQARLDPVYQPAQVQVERRSCSDADNDGVCDVDDQCLKTPRAIKVVGNGCHLGGSANVILDAVYFQKNTTKLSAEAVLLLQQLVPTLNAAGAVEIAGHSDALGNRRENFRLSEARAETVKAFLVKSGVDAAKLEINAYGDMQPLASNETALGRARNRRVSLQHIRY